jgi:hypothetical protein
MEIKRIVTKWSQDTSALGSVAPNWKKAAPDYVSARQRRSVVWPCIRLRHLQSGPYDHRQLTKHGRYDAGRRLPTAISGRTWLRSTSLRPDDCGTALTESVVHERKSLCVDYASQHRANKSALVCSTGQRLKGVGSSYRHGYRIRIPSTARFQRKRGHV